MKYIFVFLLLIFSCPVFYSAPRKIHQQQLNKETDTQKQTQIQTQTVAERKVKQLNAYEEFEIFKQAYPFVKFTLGYDKDVHDWTLDVTSYDKTTTFYYCDGLYLPKEQLENKSHYWKVVYSYKRKLTDPADFTEEEKERIRQYSSDENRKNGAVSSKFIFDAIYDCYTRNSTEKKLRYMTLWKKPLSVNRYVGDVVDRVEEKVYEIAKTNKEVAVFLNSIKTCYGYNWRQIRDSPTKSFHSYGIAIDILPRNLNGKAIYWGYEKQKGKDWMLIPLKDRWIPPAAVIKAFEDEGFIWGGRWDIWDNMHFEYHPELLIASKYYE